MPYDVNIGDGSTALDKNILADALDGTYWVSGWDATLGTGSLEVDIAAGSGAINGGDVSTGAVQTVDFTGDVDATDPRKAVISVDDTGTVQKTLGTAVPAAPTDEVRFRTYDPQPPTNASGVVVAEVWLDAGVTSLESGDVRDRRVSNQAAATQISNTPDWVELDDSPFTTTASSTISCTITEDFDEYEIHLLIDNTTTISRFIDMTVNADTGSNYDTSFYDGTTATGSNFFETVHIAGNETTSSNIISVSQLGDPSGISVGTSVGKLDTLSAGYNGNISFPLTELEFSTLDDLNWTVEVYGRNIE
jgi:hypothetical protein